MISSDLNTFSEIVGNVEAKIVQNDEKQQFIKIRIERGANQFTRKLGKSNALKKLSRNKLEKRRKFIVKCCGGRKCSKTAFRKKVVLFIDTTAHNNHSIFKFR
jgi:chaperonin GroEL (HSP60 family)